MTPQERQLIDELFDRLATLESEPRDPDAMRAITRGPAQARRTRSMRWCRPRWCRTRRSSAPTPASRNSKAAPAPNSRSPAASSTPCATRSSAEQPRGSVPTVAPPRDAPSGLEQRPGDAAAQRRATARAMAKSGATARIYGQAPRLWRAAGGPSAVGGGSFLGTAAAAAAGVVGGALLMNSFRGMIGGQAAAVQAFGFRQVSGDRIAVERSVRAAISRATPGSTTSARGGRGARWRLAARGLFDQASNRQRFDDSDDRWIGDDFGDDGGSDNA